MAQFPKLELLPLPRITSTLGSRFWVEAAQARAASRARRREPVETVGTGLPRRLRPASLRTAARARYAHSARAGGCRHGRAAPRAVNRSVHHLPTSRSTPSGRAAGRTSIGGGIAPFLEHIHRARKQGLRVLGLLARSPTVLPTR